MEVKFYEDLLRRELVVAQGCTEPLALAYAGSLASHVLDEEPIKAILECSGNIIKNVRCVAVPNSEEFNGIKASVLLGVFGGDHTKGFECILNINDSAKNKAKEFIENDNIIVNNLISKEKLHIKLFLYGKENNCSIEIRRNHLNVVKIIKNNEIVFENNVEDIIEDKGCYVNYLSFDKIFEYTNTCDLKTISDIIEKQYEYNFDIAKSGFAGAYGVAIGKAIISTGNTLDNKIKAYTASASEARMCGCVKPVIINSGSGNQGLSTSVPVIVYAKENNISLEKTFRALVLANLLTIKQKYKIGTLSAFCGVVSSCCSAGAAITYLAGGNKEQIKRTISNHLAIVPGIICDGAKASCGAKIAVCLDAALMSHHIAMQDHSYDSGDGILKESIDDTIDVVAQIGSNGMKETDEEIMKILLDERM